MTPEQLAARRSAAIADLEAQLQGQVGAAQQALYEKLLAQLKDLHADPGLLPVLLQEYANTVLIPLAAFYGNALLHLPGLNVDYFEGLDLAGYTELRQPLTGFLAARLGVDASGALVPGGYLAQVAGDTTVQRQVLTFAYQAQASGVGLEGYKAGLNALVLGGDQAALGLVQQLYKTAGDDFSRNDRMLQVLAAQQLGLTAYLYQGGLIASSRPFCVARNGRVFLDWEIARFGTKADAYGGYTNKAAGEFSGKPDPYDPQTDLGGYSCRHQLHAVPAVVAMRLRPELGEDADGKLFIKAP